MDIMDSYYVDYSSKCYTRYGFTKDEVLELIDRSFQTITKNDNYPLGTSTITEELTYYFPVIKYKYDKDNEYRLYNYRCACLDNLSFVYECLRDLNVACKYDEIKGELIIINPINKYKFIGVILSEVTAYNGNTKLSEYMKSKILIKLSHYFG